MHRQGTIHIATKERIWVSTIHKLEGALSYIVQVRVAVRTYARTDRVYRDCKYSSGLENWDWLVDFKKGGPARFR